MKAKGNHTISLEKYAIFLKSLFFFISFYFTLFQNEFYFDTDKKKNWIWHSKLNI